MHQSTSLVVGGSLFISLSSLVFSLFLWKFSFNNKCHQWFSCFSFFLILFLSPPVYSYTFACVIHYCCHSNLLCFCVVAFFNFVRFQTNYVVFLLLHIFVLFAVPFFFFNFIYQVRASICESVNADKRNFFPLGWILKRAMRVYVEHISSEHFLFIHSFIR